MLADQNFHNSISPCFSFTTHSIASEIEPLHLWQLKIEKIPLTWAIKATSVSNETLVLSLGDFCWFFYLLFLVLNMPYYVLKWSNIYSYLDDRKTHILSQNTVWSPPGDKAPVSCEWQLKATHGSFSQLKKCFTLQNWRERDAHLKYCMNLPIEDLLSCCLLAVIFPVFK